jgi:hypothetical protein
MHAEQDAFIGVLPGRLISSFPQELHPMITYWVPMIGRTRLDCRPIARHEYAVEPLII